MAMVWRYHSGSSSEPGTSEPFADRQAAEEWLAEAWAALLEHGTDEVVLVDLDDGSEIYRMSLHPQDVAEDP